MPFGKKHKVLFREKIMCKLTLGAGLPLTAENLTTPPFHVPNGKGGAYKTELVLVRTPERTEKILWWHEGDPRPEPHNHPWSFQSTILSGGYTEDRWWIDEEGNLQTKTITYRADELKINDMPANVFHVVRDVLPKTVTQLLCGQVVKDNLWGYLNLTTKEYYDAPKDPEFVKALHAINPHMRVKT